VRNTKCIGELGDISNRNSRIFSVNKQNNNNNNTHKYEDNLIFIYSKFMLNVNLRIRTDIHQIFIEDRDFTIKK
jgi:hypothetical protein